MPEQHTDSLYKNLLKTYDNERDNAGISGKRIAERIQQLSEIGTTPDGGVTRPGYSDNEKAAKEWVKKWMQEADLEVTEDGAGNIIGRRNGNGADKKAIGSGSHVDTVPNGGNFDGVVGVLSAIEVAAAWQETGYTTEKPYEAIVFSDEEGSRFNSGLTGSMAMAGDNDMANLKQQTDFNGDSFTEVLRSYGTSPQAHQDAGRNLKNELELFTEVHIEQGKKLEQENLPVGIVSGIAGPAIMEITFTGQSGHAGNTPMIGRKDPLVSAGVFVERVAHLPGEVSETAVATVGQLDVSPNGSNVIPEKVSLIVDARDIHEDTRDKLLDMIKNEAKNIADSRGIDCHIKENTRIKPIPINQKLQDDLAEVITKRGITPAHVPSGAGHDSMNLGRHIPVSMLFARSKDGASHNPEEWSSLNDIITTVHILKEFIEAKMKA